MVRAALLALLLATLAKPQSPTFEVASLKPVEVTGDLYTANLGTARHGEITLTNGTLSDCLRYAYSITNDAQIAGPEWIRNKDIRFDILAKAPPETPLDQLLMMLQNLLADRFKMVIHHEQRELSYVALTVGKNGPKLSPATADANAPRRPQIPGRIISNQMSTNKLATLLSRFMRQTVIDQTGLKGDYDLNLTWAPENFHPSPDAEPPPGPSIYTAIQEQLGLRLESRKGPVEVLVIDRAEKVPLAN